MLFNSFDYFFFLVFVALFHFALPHRLRWVLLLIASYAFYMSWNARYLALILFATAVNYAAGLLMGRMPTPFWRKANLCASVVCSLGLLFAFKYWGFFNRSAASVATWLGGSWPLPDLNVLLPVGISFYVFQSLGYTIDVYRGVVPQERHLGRFALYVAFFPQLVAGPIERARNLIPQLSRARVFEWDRLVTGSQLILWGLFKKVVVADRLALYVDAVYNNAPEHGASSYLLATYAFAFQIYCDFSAYSDIAIGSARILGVDLMTNFRSPYFSKSITEFWRRWHISLSTWLRDYLYIPLGGNRRGTSRTYVNLLITMLLGGLWHGASWNFVIWGAIHGVLLALSRASLPTRDRIYSRMGAPDWLRDGVRMLVTFHLACFAWIFFRAATLEDALMIAGGLLGTWTVPFLDLATMLHAALGLAILLAVETFERKRQEPWELLSGLPGPVRVACWSALLFTIPLFGVESGAQFIYFQF